MFCHPYPTETCGVGNGAVRSFRDNVALPATGSNQSASRDCDCQHQGGRELGFGRYGQLT